MNKISLLTRDAFLCFKSGNYAEALEIYLLLSKKINIKCFKANIDMCKLKINSCPEVHGKKKNEVYVSIIIPVYNGEKYIRRCIESCIEQELSQLEIFIINDGSTDKSLSIIQEYAILDSRIKIFNKKNEGCSVARNIGIDNAAGEYICFMDSDDFYPNSYALKKLYLKACEKKAEICGGSFSKFKNNRLVTNFYEEHECGYTFKNEGYIEFSDYQFEAYYQRFIYKKDLLQTKNIKFPPYKRFQDPPFFLNAMIAAGRFYAIQDIVYCYRIGHQPEPVDWPRINFNDRLKGINDVLQISKKAKMEKLHTRMVDRLNRPYSYDPIMSKYFLNNDTETLDIIVKINNSIDIDLLKRTGYIKQNENIFLLNELKELLRQYSRTKVSLKKEQNAEKDHNFSYYSFQDMAEFIRKSVQKLPSNIDLVVGVPRSGMIPAYMLSLFLNKPCQSFTEFKRNIAPENGNTRPVNPSSCGHLTLIVDDSVNTGASLKKIKDEILRLNLKGKFIFYTVFAKKQSIDLVDYYACVTEKTRIFQWNYMHHVFLKNCCIDLDGVLCVDPTNEENDDSENYKKFILNAKPLYIPQYKIHSIVTSRLSKFRNETEEWLKNNMIKYDNLFMLNLNSAEERRKLKCHASFKAEVYRASEATLFIESNEEQAKQIATLSGKPCLCIENDILY